MFVSSGHLNVVELKENVYILTWKLIQNEIHLHLASTDMQYSSSDL